MYGKVFVLPFPRRNELIPTTLDHSKNVSHSSLEVKKENRSENKKKREEEGNKSERKKKKRRKKETNVRKGTEGRKKWRDKGKGGRKIYRARKHIQQSLKTGKTFYLQSFVSTWNFFSHFRFNFFRK